MSVFSDLFLRMYPPAKEPDVANFDPYRNIKQLDDPQVALTQAQYNQQINLYNQQTNAGAGGGGGAPIAGITPGTYTVPGIGGIIQPQYIQTTPSPRYSTSPHMTASSPSGEWVQYLFEDAIGNIVLITIDVVYLPLIIQMEAQMRSIRETKIKMPESEFSMDEIDKAEKLIEELEGAA